MAVILVFLKHQFHDITSKISRKIKLPFLKYFPLPPHAGAFLAMAVLGRIDQMMAFKGVSLTIAPLGAVSAVLFTAPDSPAAKVNNKT
jgi:hypothetical protein